MTEREIQANRAGWKRRFTSLSRSPVVRDVLAVGVILLVAVTLRVRYQQDALVENPIRADASRYFRTAFNMKEHGVYTPERTRPGRVLARDARLPPGYPVFLYAFLCWEGERPVFVENVSCTQALLGVLTALLIYALARSCLSRPWSLTAALLTALSPHLIALEDYLLSDSLFVFLATLGTWLLTLGWTRERRGLTLLAGVVFALAWTVRPIGLLLGPFAGLALLVPPRRDGESTAWRAHLRSVAGFQLAFLALGLALVHVPVRAWRALGEPPPKDARVLSGTYHTKWSHFIGGTDIELAAKRSPNAAVREERRRLLGDPDRSWEVLKERVAKEPWRYLTWFVGGKQVFMWRWDSLYNGDIYQYPMLRRPHRSDPVFGWAHRLARWLHWPAYALALASPILVLLGLRWRLVPDDASPRALLPAVLAFAYFVALLTVLMPVPRYALPARPVSYLGTVLTLHVAAVMAWAWLSPRLGRRAPGS